MIQSFKINNNIKRISTAKGLLELTTISYKKVKTEVRSEQEQYQRKLFIDALEDMGFFYQQFLRHTKSGIINEEFEYISTKLDILLNFIAEDLTPLKEALFDLLSTDDETVLTVAVYILSSVEKEMETSPCLNKVLAHFSGCKEEFIPCYIDGLTHGKHPQLTNGLNLLKEITDPKAREACEGIIENRKQSCSIQKILTLKS